jgi:hypothetical protein
MMTREMELETPKPKTQPGSSVEELLFRSESTFLCLLLNHRSKQIRVIDFRAGALPAKRLYIQSIAKQEGVEKVITLVEKDEVSSWTKVGFVREGTIPGFYKRSDGHLCGCVIGEKTASAEVSDEGQKLAEKTIVQGKKIIGNIPDNIKATFEEPDEDDMKSIRAAALKKNEAVNTFDEFGRDAQRVYLTATVKKGKTAYISAEFQDCFGHSLVEVLKTPVGQDELFATTAALRTISESLKERGIISAFGFAPSDDVMLGAAYLASGYRKTGLLAKGIRVGNGRKDAILWTRKLANPAGDDEDLEVAALPAATKGKASAKKEKAEKEEAEDEE